MRAPSEPAEPRDGARAAERSPRALHGLLVALVLALLWTPPVSGVRAWGWDESVHAGLPALRIAVAAREGDVASLAETVLGCQQYPFVYPVALAASHTVFGTSEKVARRTGRAVWALALWGLFLAVREAHGAARRARAAPLRGASLAPWLALAAAAASPLAMELSGMLYLEVPFACAASLALAAWLARTRFDGRARLALEALTGAAVTLAFFTKFNYGLMLALGLGLDLALDLGGALRRRELASAAPRLAALCAVPATALLWWFVLPLPGGLDVAAVHRSKFAGFLLGNTDAAPVPFAPRLLHWAAFLVVSPRAFALVLLGVAATATAAARPGPRALWLVALAFVVPTSLHTFHLARFLLPAAMPLFALAGIGWGRILPRAPRARTVAIATATLAACLVPSWDAELLATRLRLLSPGDPPALAAYKRAALAEGRDLRPWRELRTAGLLRTELAAFLDPIGAEVGADERAGWIGMSSEISPGALYAGLLERGWSRASFLAGSDDEPGVHYVNPEAVLEEWSDAELAAFAARHDVLFYTDPIDVKGRGGLETMERYRDRVLALGWTAREIATVEVERALQPPLAVRLLAARPPAASAPRETRSPGR